MPRQIESTELEAVVQLLADHGFDGMARAIELLMNEAMKLQRSEALGALPYQRTAERLGHANGFTPKTVASRLGKLELQVPQTRGVEFHPALHCNAMLFFSQELDTKSLLAKDPKRSRARRGSLANYKPMI